MCSDCLPMGAIAMEGVTIACIDVSSSRVEAGPSVVTPTRYQSVHVRGLGGGRELPHQLGTPAFHSSKTANCICVSSGHHGLALGKRR
jgi:hypothetical protein